MWSIRFKDKNYSPEELTILAQEYYQDLFEEGFTQKLFDHAVKLAQRRAEFFPTMTLILSCREDAQRKINSEAEAMRQCRALLPDPHDAEKTPLEIEYDNMRLAELAKLTGKLKSDGGSFQTVSGTTRRLEIIEEFRKRCDPIEDCKKALELKN